MTRDPGFGHPFTAALAAEVVVVLVCFMFAAVIIKFGAIIYAQ